MNQCDCRPVAAALELACEANWILTNLQSSISHGAFTHASIDEDLSFCPTLCSWNTDETLTLIAQQKWIPLSPKHSPMRCSLHAKNQVPFQTKPLQGFLPRPQPSNEEGLSLNHITSHCTCFSEENQFQNLNQRLKSCTSDIAPQSWQSREWWCGESPSAAQLGAMPLLPALLSTLSTAEIEMLRRRGGSPGEPGGFHLVGFRVKNLRGTELDLRGWYLLPACPIASKTASKLP